MKSARIPGRKENLQPTAAKYVQISSGTMKLEASIFGIGEGGSVIHALTLDTSSYCKPVAYYLIKATVLMLLIAYVRSIAHSFLRCGVQLR